MAKKILKFLYSVILLELFTIYITTLGRAKHFEKNIGDKLSQTAVPVCLHRFPEMQTVGKKQKREKRESKMSAGETSLISLPNNDVVESDSLSNKLNEK